MSKQYLYKVSILNRKNSHPLEAISYYSGEDQYDMSKSKNYTSNTKDDVIWNKIGTPDKDSAKYNDLPDYLKFRAPPKKDTMSNARNILWQNVFNREKRDDAQFSRLFEISIPSFLSQIDAVTALNGFAEHLLKEGMIADCSIHSRQKNLNKLSILEKLKTVDTPVQDDNSETSLDYTGFLMCTLRDYEDGRFVNKNREWNDKKKMELWRSKWVEILAQIVNDSTITVEQKQSWEEKLTIYSEYESIKADLLQKSASNIKKTLSI
ncbi:MobA/MobL family protein [archaeon]|nr:MobA/MobL family protein [archaeon]NCQ51697.1 MobA/MobL family protein [archaeon]